MSSLLLMHFIGNARKQGREAGAVQARGALIRWHRVSMVYVSTVSHLCVSVLHIYIV